MSFTSNKRFKPNQPNDASVSYHEPFRFKRANEDDTHSNNNRSKRRFGEAHQNWQQYQHRQIMNQNQQSIFQNPPSIGNVIDKLLEDW